MYSSCLCFFFVPSAFIHAVASISAQKKTYHKKSIAFFSSTPFVTSIVNTTRKNNTKTMAPIPWQEIDIDAAYFKPPSKNGLGGQNVYIDSKENSKSNIIFQLPRSKVPFGLDKNEQSQSTRLNMELSIDNPDFGQKMAAFDQRVLTEAAKKSKAWFNGKEYTLDKLNDLELYRKSLQGNSDKYNPLFRCKVATQGAKVPKIYLLNKSDGKWSPGNLNDIQKGCFVTPIVECQGIWFVNHKNFGCTYLATHILVEKVEDDEEFPFLGVQSTPMDTDAPMQGGDDAYLREVE